MAHDAESTFGGPCVKLSAAHSLIPYGPFMDRVETGKTNALIGFRGSYAPMLSEKHNAFLRLLKKKGFKEESMPKIGLYAIGRSKTLESNKSHTFLPGWTTANNVTCVDTRHHNEEAENPPPNVMMRLHGSSIEGD